MVLPILTIPNPALREKAKPVKEVTRDLQEWLLDFEETLKKASDPEGVGLAAPQVGKNLRILTTFLNNKTKFYINPEVLDISKKLTLGGRPERPVMEGCLSVPNLYGPVWRPQKVKLKALNFEGKEFTETLDSFAARVFLHEFDHLEGVLFTDYTLRDNLPLYILKDDKFIEIPNPRKLITW